MCPGIAAIVFQMGMTRVFTAGQSLRISVPSTRPHPPTREFTVVHKFHRLRARATVEHKRALGRPAGDLLEQPLRIRPRDGQAGNLGDVRALRARRVRIRGHPRRRRVPGVEREVLHASSLHGRRVASRTGGVCFIAVLDGNGTVVANVRVDEDTNSTKFMRLQNLIAQHWHDPRDD